MPFSSSREADVRLVGNPEPLTDEEVRDLMPYIRVISEGGKRRLDAELALQNIQAVRSFDRSSTRLTWVMIALTIALLFLTAVITYFTLVLARQTPGAGKVKDQSSSRTEASTTCELIRHSRF